MRHQRTWPPSGPDYQWSECWGHACDALKAAFFILVLYVLLALQGCAALQVKQPAQCQPERLAAIEAAYVAEATLVCRAEGAKTPETCKALPAISAKYAQQREDYVTCQKP